MFAEKRGVVTACVIQLPTALEAIQTDGIKFSRPLNI